MNTDRHSYPDFFSFTSLLHPTPTADFADAVLDGRKAITSNSVELTACDSEPSSPRHS